MPLFLDRIVVMGHYSERVAANAVRQILNGLAALHKFGIVHNNLKVSGQFTHDKTNLDHFCSACVSRLPLLR
ncbi:hypothetical protein CHS0354_028568 [Potamilus streckersoni]|uniref:Protein kinase domain-containing protein n=1 Tax=Potamilus streckersoni TaxID=2493646 RepID=A0AAE0SP80_9BIVA|nr:hypothetical protein CHS0354_028568 [Potamilus streckersoni]